ncbi:MAG: mechanosensitive ion channel [Acidobacteria bacterium]|nr:mechanosensitive ion channel [Acidobacteriota bacterium]
MAQSNSGGNANSNSNSSPSSSPSPVATPIPLTAVVAEAETAAAAVREATTYVAARNVSSVVSEGIEQKPAEIAKLRAEAEKALGQTPTIEELRAVERQWNDQAARLRGWKTGLQSQIREVDGKIAELKQIKSVWQRSIEAFDAPGEDTNATAADPNAVPPEVRRRAAEALASIESAEKVAEEKRAELLTVESEISNLQSSIDEQLAEVKSRREAAFSGILIANEAPFWAADWKAMSWSFLVTGISSSLSAQWTTLVTYTKNNPGRFAVHGFLFVLLGAAFFWARKRFVPIVEEEPKLERVAAFFQFPIGSAVVLSVILSAFIYQDSPRLLNAFLGIAAIGFGVFVLRKLVAPPIDLLLYSILGLYFLDRMREIVQELPLTSRLLFTFEVLAASIFLIWFYRSRRVAAKMAAGDVAIYQRVHRVLPFVVGILVISLAANVLGLVDLSLLLGGTVLRSSYLALVLYTAAQIINSIIAFALRVEPFTRLNAVRTSRSLIRANIMRAVNWAAAIIWLLAVLRMLAIQDSVFGAISAVWNAGFAVGALNITVGDVVAFAIAIWLAFLASRLLRFLLEEDVYPRMDLGGGVSYAISSVFHYVILVGGFVFAILAVGFEFSQFAFIAGAIGVGIGFGMQTIVNNFVSGLILLFERPVKVGDSVQIGAHVGTLKSIGLRASVVRKVDGSDVIVPNSQLISEEVINWTLSDDKRRIDIPFGVAYGTDARRVIDLITPIVAGREGVLSEPSPQTLFIGLGESSLDFELRFWTIDPDGWVRLRSEMVGEIYKTLNEAGIEIPFPQRDINIKGQSAREESI